MNINNDMFANYSGIPIIVVPDSKRQNRTHKKKRINKKLAKRYGYTLYNSIEDDKAIMMNGLLNMVMIQNIFIWDLMLMTRILIMKSGITF